MLILSIFIENMLISHFAVNFEDLKIYRKFWVYQNF